MAVCRWCCVFRRVPVRFKHPRSEQAGFVLVLVLWLLVAMAILAGAIVLWSQGRVEEATASRRDVDSKAAAIAARDTILYLAATVPMTIGGLPTEPIAAGELSERRLDEFGVMDKTPRGGEIRLDGTLYAASAGVDFAIQDESGLTPVAFADVASMEGWLASGGVSTARGRELAAAVQDFADTDGFRRLNGAEAREYTRAGRPVPPNRPLTTPRALPGVLGWERLSPMASARLEGYATTAYSGALNLNTAPPALLGKLAQRCGRTCVERILARNARPFFSTRQFEIETSASLPGDRDIDFRIAPSDTFRLTVFDREGSAWRIHVRLTPLADREAPWAVEAAYRIPRPETDDAPRPIPSPLFSAPAMDRP